MADKKLPHKDVLRQLLAYDPATGKFRWLDRTADMFQDGGHSAKHTAAKWNSLHGGKEALTAKTAAGYLHGVIWRRKYFAHRVAWMYMTGEDPVTVDHINGDVADNRFSNLRSVSQRNNTKNAKKHIRNTSGFTGVFWDVRQQKWQAQITDNYKRIHLGYFDRIEDAASARKSAEAKLGFHANHGRTP